jgi:hypothetical protein
MITARCKHLEWSVADPSVLITLGRVYYYDGYAYWIAPVWI